MEVVITQTDTGMTRFVITGEKGDYKEVLIGAIQEPFVTVTVLTPTDAAAIAKIKAAILKTYGRKGDEIVRRNFAAFGDGKFLNICWRSATLRPGTA